MPALCGCVCPDSGQLPVEFVRGKPLCMELYPLLFSSCRIPGPKHDYVAHHGRGRRSPTHITVVRNYQVRRGRDVSFSLSLMFFFFFYSIVVRPRLVQSHLLFWVLCNNLSASGLKQLSPCGSRFDGRFWQTDKPNVLRNTGLYSLYLHH